LNFSYFCIDLLHRKEISIHKQQNTLLGKTTKKSHKQDIFQQQQSLSKTAIRVMSAQRLKNIELQNRINEMNIEMEKLKEENRTLKRVHRREEIAIKRLEDQDTDVARLVKNHTEETHALREIIRKLKNENRKLSSTLIDKDEEIRVIKKKLDEYLKILNDKKLMDNVELAKKLSTTEKELSNYKSRHEVIISLILIFLINFFLFFI
jgi:hypothetical protein